MEEPFSKSGHFIRVNRRRMVRPAAATALAPPTKYVLKLKLKKKNHGKHFGGIPTKNEFLPIKWNTDGKASSFIHTIQFSTSSNDKLASEISCFAQTRVSMTRRQGSRTLYDPDREQISGQQPRQAIPPRGHRKPTTGQHSREPH